MSLYQIGYMAEGFVGVKEKNGVVDVNEITPGHFYVLPKSVNITMYSTDEQRIELVANIKTNEDFAAELYADIVYILDGNKAGELQRDYKNGKLFATVWNQTGGESIPPGTARETQLRLPEAILAAACNQAASNLYAKDLFTDQLENETLANLKNNNLTRVYGLNVTHCIFRGIRLTDESEEKIENAVRARQNL